MAWTSTESASDHLPARTVRIADNQLELIDETQSDVRICRFTATISADHPFHRIETQMKKRPALLAAIAVLALAVIVTMKRQGNHDETAGNPDRPPTVSGTEPTDIMPENPAGDARPSHGSSPANLAASPLSEPSEQLTALMATLRPKVDAALRAGDYQAADRHVDEVLAATELEPLEKQRLMAVKMGTRGMRGDHAAMLALMDEIIAVDPDSPISMRMLKERPQIEKVQRLGPDHPDFCETCNQDHPPGQHLPADE